MKKLCITLCSLILSMGLVAACSSSDSDSNGSGSGNLSGKTCDKNGDIKCKSKDSPYVAFECIEGKWQEIDYSQVADKEFDVCVVVNGKDAIEPECPAKTEGLHATLLPWIKPTCAVANCAKDDRGVLYTKEYTQHCNSGGAISNNACDCGSDGGNGGDNGGNSGNDNIAGTACTEVNALKCGSTENPHLAYVCDGSHWSSVDLSQIVDHEPEVCVTLNGKDEQRSECPGNTVGEHTTILPWMKPVCAVVRCSQDSRGVLYGETKSTCDNYTVNGDGCTCND